MHEQSSENSLAAGEQPIVEYSTPPTIEESKDLAYPQRTPYANQARLNPNYTPQQRPQPKRPPVWPLVLLILLSCLSAVFLLENIGVLYYAAFAHPAEVNRANAKIGTAAANATDVASQLHTSQDFATVTVKKINLAQTQLNAGPTQLYNVVTALQPTFDDPVNNAAHSKWLVASTATDTCAFQNNVYHVTESANKTFNPCDNSDLPIVGDFAFQVQMTIVAGDNNDSGGLLFRADLNSGKFYHLDITPDGQYYVGVYKDNKAEDSQTLQTGTIAHFNPGLNQANLIMIIAQGPAFALYVNKQWVATIHNSDYSSGEIALLANCEGTKAADVTFSNTKLWDLSQ